MIAISALTRSSAVRTAQCPRDGCTLPVYRLSQSASVELERWLHLNGRVAVED